jgi:hypothetical protein
MTDQTIKPTPEEHQTSKKGGITAGILLIAIGISLLLFRIINLSELFPLFLGLAFLISGALTRKTGLIIPGGIVGGVGLGILAMNYNPLIANNQPAAGGIFLLGFAAGWLSIPLFTRLFVGCVEWWPLIPGGILAAIGALILGGETGLAILKVLGDYWPVFLIAAGAWVLFGGYFKNKK